MPSDTPAKGDVKPADVTVSGSGGGGPIAPAGGGGGGLKNLSRNQKYAVAGGAALVIGIGVYIIAKHKSSSSTSTTSAIPDASGTVAETPISDGAGSVGSSTGGGFGGGGGGGGDNLSNSLTQLFTQQDQSIAADIAALNLQQGQTPPNTVIPSGTVQPGGVNQPVTPAAAASVPTNNGASPTIYTDLSDTQALQLFNSGALSASQALADETPASQLSAAERNQQQTGNKTLRAALK